MIGDEVRKEISSGSSGTLRGATGATPEVPVGAVPIAADGGEGTLEFVLEEGVLTDSAYTLTLESTTCDADSMLHIEFFPR